MKNHIDYTQKPEATTQAKKLYNELITLNIKCELEKSDGYKHIDIAITNAFLNIEIDGSHHNLDKEQANKDLYRYYYSYIKGYNTLRIPNSLLNENIDIKNTAKMIKKMIQEKPKLYTQKYCDTIKNEAKNNKIKGMIIGATGATIFFITTTIISMFI
jgi:very-short-patch-repair endonuclease